MVNLAVKLAVVHRHKMKAIQFDEHLQFVMNLNETTFILSLLLKIFISNINFLTYENLYELIHCNMITFDRSWRETYLKSCFTEIHEK